MQHSSGTRRALTAMLAGTIVMFCSAISFAGVPTLGPDCGSTGAGVVGSDSAGKATLGVGATNSCTLTFSVPYPNAPACMATNETEGQTVAIKTTPSGAVLAGPYPFSVGDVIAYVCQDY